MSSAPVSPTLLAISKESSIDNSWSEVESFFNDNTGVSSVQSTSCGSNDFYELQLQPTDLSLLSNNAGFPGFANPLLPMPLHDPFSPDMPASGQDLLSSWTRPQGQFLPGLQNEQFGGQITSNQPGFQGLDFWTGLGLTQPSFNPLNSFMAEQFFNPLTSLPTERSQTTFDGPVSTLPGSRGSEGNPSTKKFKFFSYTPSSFCSPASSTSSTSRESSRETTPSSSLNDMSNEELHALIFGRPQFQCKTGICRWETPHGQCGHILDSDPGSVTRHLTKFHNCRFDGPELFQCQWYDCCSKPMTVSAASRHVKTHLGFLKSTCPKCQGVFSRDSSLERHLGQCNGIRKERTVRRRMERLGNLTARSAKEKILGTGQVQVLPRRPVHHST